MAWTKTQQTTAVIAAGKAGWNDQTRYMVMRSVGCPIGRLGSTQPSIKDSRNTQHQFEQYMELAEAAAAIEGNPVKPPKNHDSWAQAAAAKNTNQRRFAEGLAREGTERIPTEFDEGWGDAMAAHVTTNDTNPVDGSASSAGSIEECQPWQLRRVIEAMKARLGRALAERALLPEGDWEIPASAKRRARTDAGAA